MARASRRLLTALVAGGVLVTTAGVGMADEIVVSNASVTVAPGGSDSVTLGIRATSEEGDVNGCNAGGGGNGTNSDVTISFSSDNADVPAPAPVTVSACDNPDTPGIEDGAVVTVRAASTATDAQTATLTATASGGKTVVRTARGVTTTTLSTFSTATIDVTVDAPPPPAPTNSAPSVTLQDVTADATYSKGAVPTALCVVTDAEDGPSSYAATLGAVSGTYSADGIGSQTASCGTYRDSGGATAAPVADVTYSIVDPSAPDISKTLTPATPDGTNGWYKGDVTLNWGVSEPESPSSLTKTGCVDQNVVDDQAATTYTCSASSAGGAAAEQSVSIKRDGTAPSVSYTSASGTAGSNGWFTSDVVATFTGTDVTSGPALATQTATSLGEGAAVRIDSPAFTDAAGNTRAVGSAFRTFMIDKSAPNAPTASLSAAPNAAGWNNTDVVVSFAADGPDNGPSGIASCTADVPVSVETAGQTVSGTCTDNAGNVSAAKQVTVKLDKTGPVISQTVTATPDLPNGDNGWYTSNVQVEFTATDGLSGPATAAKTVTSSGEGVAVEVASPAFTDIADNTTAAGAVKKTYKVDLTNPTAAFDSTIGSVYFGSVPAAPSCTASDLGSGPADCTVTGYSTAVGTHTLTATARDQAGRTGTATQQYTVLPWTAKGFYQPVDMPTVVNTVKNGSTVPVKFELFAGTTELTDTNIVAMSAKGVSCTSAATDDIELLTSGSTSLRYDATSGQYIYNWKTPTVVGACYTLTMTAADGSTLSANFKMK